MDHSQAKTRLTADNADSPARASPATKYDFYFTTEGTENTEYQRLDGGAIKLHSRFHTDRMLAAIPSVISVVKNAIYILPLAVPEPPFGLQPNFFTPREDSDR